MTNKPEVGMVTKTHAIIIAIGVAASLLHGSGDIMFVVSLGLVGWDLWRVK